MNTVPRYASSEAPEVVELATMAGLLLDQWQRETVHDGLGRTSAGRWSAPKASVWVPRQNGKGGIIEALELGWLFILDEPYVLHTAHEHATAKKAYARMEHLMREARSPGGARFLHERVRQYRQTNGESLIELKSGQVLEYRTRSRTGGRGFSAPKSVNDEAQELTLDQIAATDPVVAAMDDPQQWYFGTPPDDPSAWCYGLREDGEACAPGVLHKDWGTGLDPAKADERARLLDLDEAYRCNPAMGLRIREDTVLREQRPSGLGPKYPYERLGLWRPRILTGPEKWRVVDRERWNEARDEESQMFGPETYALSVSLDGARASVSVAGAQAAAQGGAGEKVHVEVVACCGDGAKDTAAEGTAWVVPWFTRRGVKRVVVDEKGAPGVVEDLVEAGIEVVTTTGQQYAAATGRFTDYVRRAMLAHRSQPILTDGVADARTRPLAGGVVWDQKHVDTDLTGLISVTLALWGHLESGRRQSSSAYEERGFLTL